MFDGVAWRYEPSPEERAATELRRWSWELAVLVSALASMTLVAYYLFPAAFVGPAPPF
ncbi:MAG TPA: hypothetical protein VM782_18935 [Stellaceae bacterium]|nr:hypothetical protein [Stellaceae bacterium]